MTRHTTIQTLALGLVLASGAANAGLFSKKAKPAPPPPPEPIPVVVVPPPPPPAPIPLEFSGVKTAAPTPAPMDRLASASPDVLDTVQWVGATKDNAGLPFVVVDKVNAQVYAFTPHAQLKATAPVLLGGGVGDKVLVSPDAPMSAIPVQKRITPAGRYPSKLVIDNHGATVLLIDGPNLITMHIVAPGTPAQRRAERLASRTSDDNRVSFGCINVPPNFFTTVLDPDFRPGKGIVYILPEKTTPGQLFGFVPAPRPVPDALGTAAAVLASQSVPQTPGAAPINTSLTVPVSAPATSQTLGSAAPINTSLTAPVSAPATSQTLGTAAVTQVSLQAPQAQAALAPAALAPAPAASTGTFAPPASFVPAVSPAATAPVTPPAPAGEAASAGDTTAAK